MFLDIVIVSYSLDLNVCTFGWCRIKSQPSVPPRVHDLSPHCVYIGCCRQLNNMKGLCPADEHMHAPTPTRVHKHTHTEKPAGLYGASDQSLLSGVGLSSLIQTQTVQVERWSL